MAKTIANLNVVLSANISRFTSGLAKAAKPLKRFSAGIVRGVSQFAKFGAAAAAVAIGGMALLVKSQLASIDATAKLSDRLGIATEDLLGLRHAAEITGVSSAGLDKSIDMFVRRLGEAKQGTGEALRALESLGLEVDDIIAAGPAEAFKIIADSLGGLSSKSEKAAVAYQLFGRQGAALVNTLNLGRTGIEALGAEADKLGLSFNRIDAAQVEAANDSFTRMKAVFTGIITQLTVKLAPFIEILNKRFVEAALSGEGMGAKIVNAFESVLKVIAVVADFLEPLKAAFFGLQFGVTKVMQGIVTAIGWVGKGIVELINLIPGMEVEFTQFFDLLSDELAREAVISLDKATDAMDRFMTSANSRDVTEFISNLREEAMAAAEAVATSVAEAVVPAVIAEVKKEVLDDPDISPKNARIGAAGGGKFARQARIGGQKAPEVKVEGQQKVIKTLEQIRDEARKDNLSNLATFA